MLNLRMAVLCVAAISFACGGTSGSLLEKEQGTAMPAPNSLPRALLVVDTSESMNVPIDPADPECLGCGSHNGWGPCPNSCPTRLSALQSATPTFLHSIAGSARVGLVTFPNASSPEMEICRVPTQGNVAVAIPDSDDSVVLADAATSIETVVSGVNAFGGTPVAGTLEMLANYPPLLDSSARRYVVLLTDGLPNCNANQDGNACTCVTGEAQCDPRNCLDRAATVAAIQALAAKGIRTLVIGFGNDWNEPTAAAVLSEMAIAGGYARSCPSGQDAECGLDNSCDPVTHFCSRPYYRASDAVQLNAVYSQVRQELIGTAHTP